jgi:phytanoyl-CoA hydroxylase
VLAVDAPSFDLQGLLAHWEAYGWAPLGRVLDDHALEALRRRAQQIMLGEVDPAPFFFQHDTVTGDYADLRYGGGWEGPSPNYRKIEKLERDDLFRAWIANPLFERIARGVVGPEVTLYRAILMNKAASGGTLLPWHQDGGSFWGLDRDPILQVWTALDDVPEQAGCVEVVPGSHRDGLATPLGGLIPESVARTRAHLGLLLPARAGEALLLHNQVWHRSGVNRSGLPRRALSVCYMNAATRCLRRRRAPRTFVRLFG